MMNHSYTRFLLVVFTIVNGLFANAQNTPGARITAMGGVGVVHDDVWSGFHNQAGLVHLNGLSAGVYYENRFMMKELSDKGVIAALPYGNSAFALSFRSFGYSAFNNSKAGLAYALKLSDKFSFGVQLNYHTVRIGDIYGTQHNVSFDGGFLYKYNSKLTLAAHVANPNRAKLADYNDERMPSILRLGVGYKFSDKVMLSGEIKKPSDADVSVHGGLEYWVVKEMALRVGFNTLNTFSFGFGWKTKMLQIDAAAGFNSTLGFTPQIALTYTGSK
jgi:hypothetical protein